ncbi:MAG: zf-HC2 domain-containing protein, partial [Chloroflexi bacterium]|nr:zf-HC2 domain-containing protein [Chloroflexota bacterium]
MILFDRHRRTRNKLSAYIDGQLSNDEVRSLDGHLESCDSCRLELDQMRATVNAMRSLPEVETPRSFRLTPAMVAERRPVDAWSPAPPLMNGMRMAAAGLTVALAVVFVVDLGGSSRSTNDASSTGGLSQLEFEAPAATGIPPTAAAGAGGQAEQFADGADNDDGFRDLGGGTQSAGAGATARTTAPAAPEAADEVTRNNS